MGSGLPHWTPEATAGKHFTEMKMLVCVLSCEVTARPPGLVLPEAGATPASVHPCEERGDTWQAQLLARQETSHQLREVNGEGT